jgi:hypothetical protein
MTWKFKAVRVAFFVLVVAALAVALAANYADDVDLSFLASI